MGYWRGSLDSSQAIRAIRLGAVVLAICGVLYAAVLFPDEFLWGLIVAALLCTASFFLYTRQTLWVARVVFWFSLFAAVYSPILGLRAIWGGYAYETAIADFALALVYGLLAVVFRRAVDAAKILRDERVKAALPASDASNAVASHTAAVAEPTDAAKEAYDRGAYAAALNLWRPMAELGDPDAQYNLGVIYDNGQGVAQDYVQTHMWFNLASAAGQADAAKARNAVAAKMTPAQVAEAQKLASEWKPK